MILIKWISRKTWGAILDVENWTRILFETSESRFARDNYFKCWSPGCLRSKSTTLRRFVWVDQSYCGLRLSTPTISSAFLGNGRYEMKKLASVVTVWDSKIYFNYSTGIISFICILWANVSCSTLKILNIVVLGSFVTFSALINLLLIFSGTTLITNTSFCKFFNLWTGNVNVVRSIEWRLISYQRNFGFSLTLLISESNWSLTA